MAGDFLGEGRNEAFAIDRNTELVVDAIEDVGDVQGDAGFFEYVECHINLRQTFLMARTGRDGLAFAETADSVSEAPVEQDASAGLPRTTPEAG